MKPIVSIIGIQPLNYSDKIRDNFLVNFISYAQILKDIKPSWKNNIEKLYRNNHYNSIEVYRESDVELIGSDMVFDFVAYLMCNTRLNLFTIVFEFSSKSIFKTKIDTNKIRNSLVLSENDNRTKCVVDATNAASKFVSEMIGIDDVRDIIIPNDSCNVSIYMLPSNEIYNSISADDVFKYINHGDAERLSSPRVKIEISEKTVIFFGGRVHLILSSSSNDSDVIKNVFFNLQFMWYFVPVYLQLASELHLNIVSGKSEYGIDELENKSVIIGDIAQTIRLQNESEKLSYEVFTAKFYDIVEGLWGIEKSLAQFEKYAIFFDSFIKNTRENQARKADEILNYILAALAIFGIVGFWADILHAELITHEWKSFHIFERASTGSDFGLATIFIASLCIIIAVLFVLYSRNIKHGVHKKKSTNKKNN